ncbi:MAG: hypothetical protein ACK5HT_02955 [Draconibacterium sp.]
MIIKYTGSLAEQVVNGVIKMVISLSFQSSIVRVAIIAGISANRKTEKKGCRLNPSGSAPAINRLENQHHYQKENNTSKNTVH